MKKIIVMVMVALMLCAAVAGCAQQADIPAEAPQQQAQQTPTPEPAPTPVPTPVPTPEPTPLPPADYIIEEDFKEGNGLASYNAVYQVGEWIYFAEFDQINRININGNHLERLFSANLGQLRGAGAHGFTQCGEYLVFTQGSYIYKMDLATLKTEVLLSAESENTYLELAAKNNEVYFMGTEGNFADGIYKISIDGDEPEKILSEGKGTRLRYMQLSNDQIFYSIPYKGLYSVNLDGSNKQRILKSKHVGWESFVITDDYIYFMNSKYSLQRADLDGKNITKLVDSCKDFSITDDCIIYTKLAFENNYYFGTDIYKLPLNKKGSEKIYEGDVGMLMGRSGNWIYFIAPYNSSMLRVRLDGTGEMVLYA